MLRHKTILLLLCIFFVLTLSSSAKEPVAQVRIYFDKSQWQELRQMHLDVIYGARIDAVEPFIDAFVTTEELQDLNSLGVRVEVTHEDIVAFYQSRLPAKDMGGYMTLSEINDSMDALIANFPTIFSNKISIGQTIEGRDIWAAKISDNPNVDEDEVEVLLTAAIHAREVITPLVLFNYAQHILTNYGTDPDITAMVDEREIWLIFCCNPDGYYHNEVTDPLGGGYWRKNRRDNGDGTYGVDLNRNWGYEWGYDNNGSSPNTSDQTYRGTAPFSEPETQAFRDFHIAREFVISVYFHSYSDLILWPWGYDAFYTPDEDIFAFIGDSCATWNGYSPGVTWDNIYEANGGSDDWIYGEQALKNKTLGFTFEVGSSSDGFWPNPINIPTLCAENLQPMLFLTEVADHAFAIAPPAAPQIAMADSITPDEDLIVAWNFDDTVNPAVEFELAELSDPIQVTDLANDFSYCSGNDMSVSVLREYSAPTSFFSGSSNNRYSYVEYDFPFKVTVGDSLYFYTWYDIEDNWDYAYVEVSTDGTTFTTIEGNITTTSDPNGNNRGHGITGSSGGWVQGKFDLSAYAGQKIKVRLSYDTDGYVLEEGIYFDNIYPIDDFTTQTPYSLTPPDTSYNFGTRDLGDYYFKVRAKDAEDQWSDYSSVEKIKVYEQYLCGDANGTDNVDVSDAVYIVNFIFVSGSPAPDPFISGDSNCDGLVNVSDAVAIINFIFAGGNAPCDTDGDSIPDC